MFFEAFRRTTLHFKMTKLTAPAPTPDAVALMDRQSRPSRRAHLLSVLPCLSAENDVPKDLNYPKDYPQLSCSLKEILGWQTSPMLNCFQFTRLQKSNPSAA